MSNRKISQLTAATTVTGPDVLPIVNGGATKKVTLATLSGYFGGGGGGGAGPTGPTGPAGAGEAYQGSTAPASASPGATWLDTSSGGYFTRYEGVWVEVGGKHYP